MADLITPYNKNAVTVTGAGGTALLPTSPQPPITPAGQTNPAVISSTAATNDLSKIQTNLQNVKTGMTSQASNNEAYRAKLLELGAAQEKAAQDKAVAQAKITADTAKANALSGNTTSNTTTGQTTPNNAVVSPEQDEANRLNQQAFDRAQITAEKIDGIQNGSIPLSQGEQAQVTELKNQFQNLIEQTGVANKNYEQGLQILGASSGRQRYTPATHLGQINDAIQKGIQKVADLNVQMAGAVGKMEQAFKDSDIDKVKEQDAIYQKAFKDRVDFLNQTAKDAATAAKDARDFAYRATQDLIQNNMLSDKFDYQKSQDAINNAFQQGQLSETQRHNLAQEALSKAAQQGADGGGIPGLPTVNMTGENKPDSAQQEAFLASLPPDVATLVKGIANYQLNLSTSPQKLYKGTSGLTQSQMAALVLQYDPTFSQSQFATRQAYMKNLQSGQIYQGIVAGNKAINHLASFAEDVSNLQNIYPFSGLNKASQVARAPFSGKLQTTMKEANTEANGVKDELAKFFKGTGASDVLVRILHNLKVLYRGR